jgi:hypothetical protein
MKRVIVIDCLSNAQSGQAISDSLGELGYPPQRQPATDEPALDIDPLDQWIESLARFDWSSETLLSSCLRAVVTSVPLGMPSVLINASIAAAMLEAGHTPDPVWIQEHVERARRHLLSTGSPAKMLARRGRL